MALGGPCILRTAWRQLMSKLFRIIYCSRSCIPDEPEVQEAELEKILAAARRNNLRNDITGALLFTERCFAQALEGELFDIEATLAKIERDPRHADVRCLECGPIANREFSDWSMAFAGKNVTDNPRVGQAMTDAFSGATSARADLLSFLRQGIYRIPIRGQ
jgi:hypothetical protein